MSTPEVTLVLVPGGWHGGWAYDPVADRLRARGHRVVAVTPAGLEAAGSSGANLDTHVGQVAAAVRDAPGPVVLAGHSYGGMIVTGVADRLPGRVAHLVYLDAYVPGDGDTCWALTSDRFRAQFVAGAVGDGRAVAVPPRLDPRARPHPLGTMLQALRLTHPTPDVPRTFVYGGPWKGSPFVELAERLRADPAWTVVDLPVGHDVMNRDPDGVARVLDDAADRAARVSAAG